jgi:outer membrane lipoprotein SlyB
MKTNTLVFAMAVSAVVLTGCQNPDGTQNNTGSGALIGGALGAITGAAIGGPRNGGAGALIGAAAGAIGGGLIGNSMDQEQNARLRAEAPQTYVRVQQNQPLAVADVKALALAKVGDDVIINQIRASRTVYHLSAADIIDLRNSGVSENVINFMINTPTTIGGTSEVSTTETVVSDAPPAAPAETVTVVQPGPDYYWIDGEYDWNGITWVWVGGHWGYPPHPHAVWVVGRSWHDDHGWHNSRGHWH